MGSRPTGTRLARISRRFVSTLAALAVAATVAHGALAAPTAQSSAMLAEMRQQVSQIRGLELKAETPVVPLARSSLVDKLARAVNEPRAVREFLTSQMLLEVLGAMPRRYDLRQLQLQLLEEQTLAIYDYDERVIFLAAEVSGDLSANERLVLAHELTHALQDQHFGLRHVLPQNPQSSDADLAARALVEGDAMLTMRIWGRQHLRPSDKRSLGDDPAPTDPALSSAPPLVQGELMFPYDAGWIFAQLLYQDGGYAAVDRALQNPPRSTEQILHPEKYLAGEQPVTVSITPLEQALRNGWRTLRTDTFGELVLRLLLEPGIGWPEAEAAAGGWAGDTYTILEDERGRRIVGMVTVWDTDAEAAQYYNAFAANIAAQFGAGAARTVTLASLARWTTPEYQIQVIKTDNVVRVVYAPDATTVEQVETELSEASIGAAPSAPRPGASPADAPATAPSPTPQTTRTATPTPSTTLPGSEDEPVDIEEPASPTRTPTPSLRPPMNSTPTPTAEPMQGAPSEGDGEEE